MNTTRILLLTVLAVMALLPAVITAQLPSSKAQQQRARITEQLKKLRLNQVQFTDATAEEAIAFLQIKSREADLTKQGVNLMLKLPDDEKKTLPKISLSLKDVPLGEALRYVAQLSGLILQVEAHAAVLTSASYAENNIVTRVYNVPPDFLKASGVIK